MTAELNAKHVINFTFKPFSAGIKANQRIDDQFVLTQKYAENQTRVTLLDAVKYVNKTETRFIPTGKIQIIDAGNVAKHVVTEGGIVAEKTDNLTQVLARNRNLRLISETGALKPKIGKLF